MLVVVGTMSTNPLDCNCGVFAFSYVTFFFVLNVMVPPNVCVHSFTIFVLRFSYFRNAAIPFAGSGPERKYERRNCETIVMNNMTFKDVKLNIEIFVEYKVVNSKGLHAMYEASIPTFTLVKC